jgi:hypothetical protein
VALLSIAQHRQAPAIRTTPQRSVGLPDQESTTLPTTTSAVPATTLRPSCSRKMRLATIVVNTSSRFSSSEAVAAGTRPSPAASSTGPTAPPSTTASERFGSDARTSRRVGGFRPTNGATTMAAPM